jgi:ATP-dependent HslUV protease subunit HslV
VGSKYAFHATTILAVKLGGVVAIGGDGQVTLGSAVMKSDAVKIRKLLDGRVLCGFAGSSADAFSLLEKFEQKLKDSPANLVRAATELAKQWRTDKMLRQLEAFLLTTDGTNVLLISGTGDVIQPTDGIAAIGSGGNYALAAAKALIRHSSLSAADVVQQAMTIASEIDIYTNNNIVIEQISGTAS